MNRLLKFSPARITRIALLALMFSFIASASLPAQIQTNRPALPRRPNIILFLADNVGTGDIGGYGPSKILTPNLDKLASEGTRFTSFYADTPNEDLARATLFTGITSRRLNLPANQMLPPDAITLAEFLKEQRYHCGLIGLWGLGDLESTMPDKHGFDEFAGFLGHGHARDYYTDKWWRHDTRAKIHRIAILFANSDNKRKRFVPDEMAVAASGFIRNNKPAFDNMFRPFFLTVAYAIPHDSFLTNNLQYENQPWPEPQKRRAALITRMDAGIGQILSALQKHGQASNTVVVFTSVNAPKREGGMDPALFNSAGLSRGFHGDLFEGGLRVPLIVRWPGVTPAGRAEDLPCTATDLFPTLADISLVQPTNKIDGISLLPVLTGKPQTNRHESFLWTTPNGAQAVRFGDWKAIRSSESNRFELYNLKSDPAEKTDVADKNPEAVRKAEQILSAATR